MLSICIPVYNFEVSGLVKSLDEQARRIEATYEIILIDDHSEREREQNARLAALPSVQYIELSQNLGRAAIRNHFLKYAQHEYLLFMDCDSGLVSEDYLTRYYTHMKDEPAVICGGRVYPPVPPDPAQILRWKYGVKLESKSAAERMKAPHRSFMTNNFVIRRELLDVIRFDARLREYGHEDTLFGLALKRRGVRIRHIENPLRHEDLEEGPVFMEKTQHALRNLRKLASEGQFEGLWEDVKLLRTFAKFRRWGFSGLLRTLHRIFHRVLYRQLTGRRPKLWLFNFYKLGYFSSLR